MKKRPGKLQSWMHPRRLGGGGGHHGGGGGGHHGGGGGGWHHGGGAVIDWGFPLVPDYSWAPLPVSDSTSVFQQLIDSVKNDPKMAADQKAAMIAKIIQFSKGV